jgi:hypothetical protein
MKTIFYLLAFCFCIHFNVKAQSDSYQIDGIEPGPIVKKNDCDGLQPVYFNYTKRRLYSHNKMPLNGRHFLDLCRGINDSGIQHQVRRYDQLTSNKRKILGAMITCGVAGYITMIGSMMALSTSGPTPEGAYTTLGIGAASLFIATPILAISSGIPHQKRKEILFRDLPEAYNFHVLSNPNK